MIKNTQLNILNNKKILYFFLFLVIFSYFLWLNSTPSFSDPDSFYHAKMVDLIRQDGIVHDFNWLPFTTLNEIYIDHHLLYHLILVPLTLIINSLLAVKLAAVFFASMAILVFQWLLDKFKIKYSFIYTLILLFAHQFIFRINLAKVPSLSLIVLLLFIYLIFTNQKKWSWKLFFLSFIYIWLYGGWPIMIGIAFIYFIVSIVFKFVYRKKTNYELPARHSLRHQAMAGGGIMNYGLKFINTLSGIITGLIINPYFPTNLKFYWQQTFQIGLVNYKDIVGVGGEWYGLNIFDIIRHDVFIFILLTLALLIFFVYLKKNNCKIWTLFITAIIFFALTLKSQRNIEYFTPFSVLFSAVVINQYLNIKGIKYIKEQIKLFITKQKTISTVFMILLIFYLPILFASNFKGLKENLRKNYHFSQFKNTSNWLELNSQKDEIIFHDNWDDWPVFFYHNSYNRYIVGLDPTFMYFKNKRQYWRWENIAIGRTKENICQTIKDKFHSNYIFVKVDNQKLKDNLDLDNKCQLAYQDEDGWIFKIN